MAALSRQAESLGMDLSTQRIGTHREHREAETPVGEGIAKRQKDFAVLVREKAIQQLESGELDLTDKDAVPGINAGLKAQALIDKREQAKKNTTQADMLVALLGTLRGDVPMLEDPSVIEGTAVEITDAV
jgi:hypothetical protein